MHFGMTGWVHIRGERTAYTNYYKKLKEADIEQWPPRFWKFSLKTEEAPEVEVAFTDARRFGRVRLVNCPGEDIRKHSPLVENGPDPVIDTNVFTESYLSQKMKARHVPIKALLLDQTTISGIGNWVADETLYQAKLHPEQYCDDFGDDEITKLYKSIRYVCQTAVDKLGDSDEFPEHWMFNYRWGKGDKNAATKLPNGEKLAFITVGGRTSCYAPGVQKKTGRVIPGIKAEPVEGGDKARKPKRSRELKLKYETEEDVEEDRSAKKKKPDTGKTSKKAVKVKSNHQVKVPKVKREEQEPDMGSDMGRRRSSRRRE